jgi:hypothetical protein
MKPLTDARYRLEKFSGKGGWTYAAIPEIPPDKSNPFGWKKVKGSIDGYPIEKYHLMPMGAGRLMLAVNAEIRKKIGKKAGDEVHVILYPDHDVLQIPEELQLCLADEPAALHFFNTLSDSEKKFYIQWIFTAKKEETKIRRMATAVNRLRFGLKMHGKTEE